MNVMNRKLFANRDARRKLASMGGIVTSSPELINTVQSFRRGGRTITFGNTKLVLFDDGEMYAELEDGSRVKLNETQKAEIKALLKIRNERLRDEVIEKGATAKGPGVFADTLDDISTVSPEVSEEVEKQSRVLKVLAAGKGLAETAKEFGLGALEVADIAGGVLGLGFNELSALTGEGIATLLNAAGVPEDFNIAGVDLSPSAFAREAGDIRQAGRDFLFDEGNIAPRLTGIPLSYIEDRLKADEEQKALSDFATQNRIGPIRGALTTPEQRAEIAAQSDAAIKRASAETLRDTGESVPFTGRTDLLSVKPKSGVMSSLDGSEVLFDLLQGGDTVPDKTALVGFEGGDRINPPVSSSSGVGEGIMSQAPGFSVPDVEIGEAGLERAREIAERETAIRNALQDPSTYGITDVMDFLTDDDVGIPAERRGYNAFLDKEDKKRLRATVDNPLEFPKYAKAMNKISFPQGGTDEDEVKRNKAVTDLNRRALDYYRTDTFVPPSEIYGDVIGGDVPTIAKYQGASPEEVQAIRDRLAREAAAEEAAKEQGFFTEKDEDIQSEYDEALAKQQAMLDADADAASLEDLKTTAEEIEEKKKKIDPETLPVLGEEDADAEARAAQEESFSLSDAPKKIQENLKKNPDNPAGAVTKTTLNDEGIDTSNMSLKERVKSMRGVLSELVGDSDEDKNEEFWLAMARIGFGVAAGEDPNALKNIADGVLDGITQIAKDRKADKKRDDDLTLAAFDMVRQDERDALNYQRQIGLIDARQRATQDEDISNAFRLQKNAYVKSLTDMVPAYGPGSNASIEEINRKATDLAFQDLATQFSPTVLKQSTLYQSPSNKTFIDNAIEALNAQQYL